MHKKFLFAAIASCSIVALASCNNKTYTLTLDKNEATIKIDDILNLNVTINPEVKDPVYTWSSSNDNVASVNNNGVVIGKSIGDATITVSYLDKAKATCAIHVEDNLANYLDVNGTKYKFNFNGNVGTATNVDVKANDQMRFYYEKHEIDYARVILPTDVGDYKNNIQRGARGMLFAMTAKKSDVRITVTKSSESEKSYEIFMQGEYSPTPVTKVSYVSVDGDFYDLKKVGDDYVTERKIDVLNADSVLEFVIENEPLVNGHNAMISPSREGYKNNIEVDENNSFVIISDAHDVDIEVFDGAEYGIGYLVYSKDKSKNTNYVKIGETNYEFEQVGGDPTHVATTTISTISKGQELEFYVNNQKMLPSEQNYPVESRGGFENAIEVGEEGETFVTKYAVSNQKVEVFIKGTPKDPIYEVYIKGHENTNYVTIGGVNYEFSQVGGDPTHVATTIINNIPEGELKFFLNKQAMLPSEQNRPADSQGGFENAIQVVDGKFLTKYDVSNQKVEVFITGAGTSETIYEVYIKGAKE